MLQLIVPGVKKVCFLVVGDTHACGNTDLFFGTQVCACGGDTCVCRERERERARERERHMLAWGPHMCAEANVCGHTNVCGDTFL